MKPPKHWQDPVSAAVGVAILVSPWPAGYAMVQPALANAVIVGSLLFTGAIAAAVIGRPWVECGILALGAWLLASPWVLAFTDVAAIRVAVLLGGVVLVLGGAALGAEWRARARVPRAIQSR
jgi:hypothetical protein